MKLTHAPGHTTRMISPPTSDTEPVSEIMIAGVPTGKTIQGAVLETALRWNDYVLLFLKDDVPFEEGLNIYLLDADLNIIDSAHMCFIYATGVFSDLDLTQPDTVRFHFIGEMVWTLKLFHEKTFAFPFISSPLGVSRPLSFFRRFQIYDRPLPTVTDSTQADAASAN